MQLHERDKILKILCLYGFPLIVCQKLTSPFCFAYVYTGFWNQFSEIRYHYFCVALKTNFFFRSVRIGFVCAMFSLDCLFFFIHKLKSLHIPMTSVMWISLHILENPSSDGWFSARNPPADVRVLIQLCLLLWRHWPGCGQTWNVLAAAWSFNWQSYAAAISCSVWFRVAFPL